MADEIKKGDFTLADGREITFDLKKISRKEWLSYVQGGFTSGEDDAILARVAGLTPDYIAAMSYEDWRLLAKALMQKATRPLSDPN